MRISANTYLLESITWIPIQILYVHRHFDITCNSHSELGLPVGE